MAMSILRPAIHKKGGKLFDLQLSGSKTVNQAHPSDRGPAQRSALESGVRTLEHLTCVAHASMLSACHE